MPCSLRVSKIRLSRSWAIFKQFSSLTRAYVRDISCPNTVVVATLETRVASKAKKGPSAGPLLPHRGGISECVGALYLFLSWRSEEHTSELQSPMYLVCRLLLEK